MCVDYMREIEVAEFCVLHIAAFHLFINSMFPCSLFAGVKRERPKVVLEAEFLFGRWQRINNQILAHTRQRKRRDFSFFGCLPAYIHYVTNNTQTVKVHCLPKANSYPTVWKFVNCQREIPTCFEGKPFASNARADPPHPIYNIVCCFAKISATRDAANYSR
jgi:hypothetical protein